MDNIFCIECGFELPSNAKFCKKCGVQIEASESPAEVVTEITKEETIKSESEPEIKQDKQPSTQPVTEETPTQKIFSTGGGVLQRILTLILIFICGGVGGFIGVLFFVTVTN